MNASNNQSESIETAALSFLAANGLKKKFKRSLQAFEELRGFYKDDTPGGDNSIFEGLEITPEMRSQLKSARDASSFVAALQSLPVVTTPHGEKLSAASMLLFSSEQPLYNFLDECLSFEDFKKLYKLFVIPITERKTELQLQNCALAVARILKEGLMTLDEIEKSIYPTHWSGNHTGLWRQLKFFKKAFENGSISVDDIKKRLVDLKDIEELGRIFQTTLYIDGVLGASEPYKEPCLMKFILDNFLIDDEVVNQFEFPHVFGEWTEYSGVKEKFDDVWEYLRFLNTHLLEKYYDGERCGDGDYEKFVPNPNASEEIENAISRAAWCTSFKQLSKDEKVKLYDKIKENLDVAEAVIRPIVENNLGPVFDFESLQSLLNNATKLKKLTKSV